LTAGSIESRRRLSAMRTFSRARDRWKAVVLLAGALLFGGIGSAFAQSASPPAVAETRLAEARRHFDLGVAHFDREEWQAALVEFLQSRELAPSRGNTKNAAICLRKMGRFDEALDMFEALLRHFPDLSVADRELARREMEELGASVGTIEIRDAPPGAQVSVNGVSRGTTPLAGPIRLPAGTHTVRVVKDGLPPFETRVDLAGRRAEVVHVRIAALTQAGRLRVGEKNGRTADVIVDGARVGTTPWDGALAPGVHSVALRGQGTLGTPPTRVVLRVGKETALELAVESLTSELEVIAEPLDAEILVDGAPVGRGSWKGRQHAGAHHVEVVLGGHEPFARTIRLAEGERRRLSAVLEPELANAILLQLDAGIPLGFLWGGDLDDGCASSCSPSLPIGFYALAHAIHRFGIGVGVGVHAGYLRMWTTLSDRVEFHDVSRPEANRGLVDDHLRLAGLLAGAEADYATGTSWPLTLRVSAGALLGAVTDTRTGAFVDSDDVGYEVSFTQSRRASFFYVSPEVRIGYRVAEHFEASVGTKLFVLAALSRPAWDGTEPIGATATDRGGVFAPASLTGGIMLAVMPGMALTYSF
jgi:hypothetical protein